METILYQKHKHLIIVGTSGHGKVLYDLVKGTNAYDSISFVDDNYASDTFLNEVYLGTVEDSFQYINTHDFFVGIGNNAIRKKISNTLLQHGANLISMLDPFTSVSSLATIGRGSCILKGACVGIDAMIGDGVILNTGCSVDHDCSIGNYVHVSVGAHVAGTVHIGEGSMLGAGSTVINNLSLCENVILGAGAVVIESLKEAGTYVGVPCKLIKR